ncbi:MAG: ATP-binding protein, partial [Candidatus Competibacteraceae bacterium]
MNPTEAGKPRLRKFHIGTGQSDQEIIDQFVVRKNQLDSILEVLEGNIDADSCQHLLVVAPRGRGKTTLLVRVMAELRSNDRFSARLLPIRLMEESQEIFNLADFWLECLYYLAKSCVKSDSGLADELAARHAALAEDWADKTLEGRARAAVLDAADRLDRRLVVMVENLQSLCDEADKAFGWSLRQVLQSEPQIMLLATATSRFEALENAREPFFEMFRTLCLPPLDVAECRLLWQAISGETVDERGIRPLRILTGGSPRLMVVLAGFTRDRSLRQLMEQLVNLIDDHTEYFRGHLEELASTERRVYIALIDLWQASTTAEVAARARMEIRTVSSLLGRLVNRGAVVVEGSGKKRTYYAAERLYSIYYKLRRDRDEAAVVRNLVHFMVTYYQGAALAELSRGLVAEASESEGIREGLLRAAAEMPELRELVEAHGFSLSEPSVRSVDPGTPEALVEIRQRFKNADYAAVVSLVDDFLCEADSRSSTADSVAVATA